MRSYIIIAVAGEDLFDPSELDIVTKLKGREIESRIIDTYGPTICDACGKLVGVHPDGTEVSRDHSDTCKYR